MDTLQTINQIASAGPELFGAIVTIVVGGIGKWVIEKVDKMPIANGLGVPSAVVLSIGLAWGISKLLAPELTLPIIAVLTLTGLGLGSVAKSSLKKTT